MEDNDDGEPSSGWRFDEIGEDEFEFGYEDGGWTGKDCSVFLVDGSAEMFEKPAKIEDSNEEPLCPFELSMKCIRTFMNRKAVCNERDRIGIVVYGTGNSQRKHVDKACLGDNQLADVEHVCVMQAPAEPSAERVLDVESFYENDDAQAKFVDEFGEHSTTYSMTDAIWVCVQLLSNDSTSKLGKRNVFIMTNNDEPHKGNPKSQSVLKQRIRDFQGIDQMYIHVLPIGAEPGSFDWSKFYSDVLTADGENAIENSTNALRTLLSEVRQKEHKRRSFGHLNWNLGPGVDLAVNLFHLISATRRPSAVSLYRKTNEEVQTRRITIVQDTGEVLLPAEMKKTQVFGKEKISLEVEELKNMKYFGQPSLVLLGFKPVTAIKPQYHLKAPLFLYPNDASIRGSGALFAALLTKCAERQKAAICRLLARQNMPPKLVALIPQAEEKDATGVQLKPPGFHVVVLPYRDDVRKMDFLKEQPRPRANEEQIEKARAFVDKLTAWRKDTIYTPDRFENPALQVHYRCIEALALEREKMSEFEDQTVPKFDSISRRAGDLLTDFRNSVFPADYNVGGGKRKAGAEATAAKKAKTEAAVAGIDIEHLTKAGLLEKQTVAVLKEAAAAKGIKLTATKKADIISQISKHFGQ